MSKNVKVDFTSKMITVTKSFLKRAETPFSDEFQLLVALQKELPNFKLAVEKNRTQPKQFRPSYSQMKDYITFQPRSEELMEEFSEVRAMSRARSNPYMFVFKWFVEKFPMFASEHFDVRVDLNEACAA